jgi:hypothetical protein
MPTSLENALAASVTDPNQLANRIQTFITEGIDGAEGHQQRVNFEAANNVWTKVAWRPEQYGCGAVGRPNDHSR